MVANIPHKSEMCIIAPWVVFGEGCIVRDFAVVGRMPTAHHALARAAPQTKELIIGASVEIGTHAILYAGCVIGDDTLIGDGASVREGATIGKRCVIGRNVTVHYDAQIGNDVRIIDGSHITGGAKIGAGTFIGVGVVMSNDRRREIVDYEFDPDAITPPEIGSNVLIGSGACIIPGVKIGDKAIIGAGALVTHDVPAGGVVLGPGATIKDANGVVVWEAKAASAADRQLAAMRALRQQEAVARGYQTVSA